MDEDWISITDAAARLTKAGDQVTRSTLSRYLKKHADALETRSDGKSTLVDYVCLRQHRGENIRLVSAPPRAVPEPTQSLSGNKADAGGLEAKPTGAVRKSLADAELKELDLAERRSRLTPTAEVEKAGRDAIALMRSSFERAVESEAATLAVKYGWDERTIRLALKSFAREGVDVFHREILQSLDRFRRTQEASDLGSTDVPSNVATDRLQ